MPNLKNLQKKCVTNPFVLTSIFIEGQKSGFIFKSFFLHFAYNFVIIVDIPLKMWYSKYRKFIPRIPRAKRLSMRAGFSIHYSIRLNYTLNAAFLTLLYCPSRPHTQAFCKCKSRVKVFPRFFFFTTGGITW